MSASIILGMFSAELQRDGATGDTGVTVYDCHDTSIVDQLTLEGMTDRAAMDRVWLHLRDLNFAEVVNPDHVGGGPKIVGFSFEADHHCLDCTRDRFGHAAMVRAMRVQPDAWNTLHLLNTGYPKDREGNAICAIMLVDAENWRDTDEDQRVTRCGDCTIALCEPIPVAEVDLVGFEDDDPED